MEEHNEFSGKSAIYEKYRPSYPHELMEHLSKGLGMSGTVVADIGAGTGIFSRLLAAFADRVFSVEPNAEMRRANKKSSADFKNITMADGTTEHTGLQRQSVDFVTAAQAFHWFDHDAFRIECRRILEPHGKAVLVWNSIDADDDVIVSLGELYKSLGRPYRGPSSEFLEDDSVFRNFYRDGSYARNIFENRYDATLDEFAGRHLSSSYAPMKGDKDYRKFRAGLEAIFERLEKGGKVALNYRAACYAGEV